MAAKAPKSEIPEKAPMGGTFRFKTQVVKSFKGNVFSDEHAPDVKDKDKGDDDKPTPSTGDDKAAPNVPAPGQSVTAEMINMAGGGKPSNYNWGDDISEAAVSFLQLLQFFDDILLQVLWQGYNNLHGGSWAGIYPKSIVETIGSMAAQALVHRTTVTDCLQHYDEDLLEVCDYKIPNDNADEFLHATLTLLLLEIGVLTDVSALIAQADPWLVPVLVSEVGA